MELLVGCCHYVQIAKHVCASLRLVGTKGGSIHCKALDPFRKGVNHLFLGFLGKDRCWPSATCIHKAGSSWLSTLIACNNLLKSTNAPVAAAVINLAGMVGMVPLNGAKRGLDGPG